MLQNGSKKIPFVQVRQTESYEVENLIKNPPCKLHNIHQSRGILRALSNI